MHSARPATALPAGYNADQAWATSATALKMFRGFRCPSAAHLLWVAANAALVNSMNSDSAFQTDGPAGFNPAAHHA